MTEVLDQVRSYSGENAFLLSLKSQLISRGTLSDKQLDAAARNFAPKPTVIPSLDGLGGVVSMLAAAGSRGLQYPKIRFFVGDVEMALALKSARSKAAGSVDIVTREKVWNARFNQFAPEWHGRITPDGVVSFSSLATPALVDALAEFAKDALGAVIKYGKLTGNCCFCRKELSTPNSLAAGYGPDCAEHYGLPWG